MNSKQLKFSSIPFLPSGRPAPAVLTDQEVIELLRLDPKSGHRTIKFYRDEGLITGIRIGRHVRYPLSEVMRFLAEKTEHRP